MKQNIVLIAIAIICILSCNKTRELGVLPVSPTLELKNKKGNLYTPSTQSLLRTHSWLESVKNIQILIDNKDYAEIEFLSDDSTFLKIKNLEIDYLVPRLHYEPVSPPDDFDAFNLMLSEFSRNSISMPQGSPGDAMTHYQTNLNKTVPWKLSGDFQFVPEPRYKPLRVSVINNCLKSGLWELNAIDRSGEIYHSWFSFPEEEYYPLVARTNQVDDAFVRKALNWKEEKVRLDLSRLRDRKKELDKVNIEVKNEEVSFSSQGSRRKLSGQYVRYKKDDVLFDPKQLNDLTENPVFMSTFIEPGIYSYNNLSEFNFSFLKNPLSTEIYNVIPKTKYDWVKKKEITIQEEEMYLEFIINLPENEKIVLGNLPLHLLVQQEDFVLNGFGVGILNASGFAERRKFLIQTGPNPSFAYLMKEENGSLYGMNSHDRGIEQIFIRSHPFAQKPYWEVTITSYERIADLVKYKILMPASVIELQKKHSKNYITPLYFSYRDDNIN